MASSLKNIFNSCNKRWLMQAVFKLHSNRSITTSQQILSNCLAKKEEKTLVSRYTYKCN